MVQTLAIGLGGAVGAMARYHSTLIIARWLGPELHWPTLVVNTVGCLCLGGLLALGDRLEPTTRAAVTTGLLGAFTTYSTFSVHTVQLAESGKVGEALGNVVLHLVMGFAAAAFGMWAVRRALV